MKTLVMKFGGKAVATPLHFSPIANIIKERKKNYDAVVVVVSAMGNTTDQLIALAKEVHPNPPQREYDMLLTVGERISISLLAMALAAQNCDAVSFTGSQSGIITCDKHTEARIIQVKPQRLMPHLNNGKIVIVAGFQGVSVKGEITTLGRGGSDTSAVALGAALQASEVEFFKDVPGIFSEDPKKNAQAKFWEYLNYKDALAIVLDGSKVLHSRSVELAQKNGIPLHVRSFHDNKIGTIISDATAIRSLTPIYEN